MSVTVYSKRCSACGSRIDHIDFRAWTAPTGPESVDVRHVEFVIPPCQFCLDLVAEMTRREHVGATDSGAAS